MDRTADTGGLVGYLESNDGGNTLSVDGLGLAGITLTGTPAELNVSELDVSLGAGNDLFTVNNPIVSSLDFVLDTGAGDDGVVVDQAASPTHVAGGIGSDTVTAQVAGAPTSFPNLTLNGGIETLVVNNNGFQVTSGTGAPATTVAAYGGNVDWTSKPGELDANGNLFISTAGAGTTHILGGSGANTLTVQSQSAAGVTSTINGDHVELIDGQQVLQYVSQDNTISKTGTLTGLNGATDVAVTSDGQFVYVAGKFDDSITVFRRGSTAGQLLYVQTLQTHSTPSALDGTTPSADWVSAVKASNPNDWYRFDETQTLDPTTQTLVVGNQLYALSQSASTLRVFGKDGGGQFTVLLQTIATQSNPVSFDKSPAGDVLYVLNQASGDQTHLTSYTRDTVTGLLTFETTAIASGEFGATAVRVSTNGDIQVVGGSVLATTFVRNALHQLVVNTIYGLTSVSPTLVVDAVPALDVGRTSGYGSNVYYGTDNGFEVVQNGAKVGLFPGRGGARRENDLLFWLEWLVLSRRSRREQREQAEPLRPEQQRLVAAAGSERQLRSAPARGVPFVR